MPLVLNNSNPAKEYTDCERADISTDAAVVLAEVFKHYSEILKTDALRTHSFPLVIISPEEAQDNVI